MHVIGTTHTSEFQQALGRVKRGPTERGGDSSKREGLRKASGRIEQSSSSPSLGGNPPCLLNRCIPLCRNWRAKQVACRHPISTLGVLGPDETLINQAKQVRHRKSYPPRGEVGWVGRAGTYRGSLRFRYYFISQPALPCLGTTMYSKERPRSTSPSSPIPHNWWMDHSLPFFGSSSSSAIFAFVCREVSR